MGDIRLEKVGVRFRTKDGFVQAVNGVDIDFKSGEITGMIGETGSGKSVLGMSILKLLASNSEVEGEIYYQDKNLLDYNEKELEKIRGPEIGFVPQNPGTALNPIMKIGKQLIEGFIYHKKISKKEGSQKVSALLSQFSFTNPEAIANNYAFQLSGGMRQRVLCGTGSALHPPWLIADEPTKGLDAILRYEIYEVFKKLKDEQKISMIIITHDLRLARKICDTTIVLYAGVILEEGSSEEIFENPKHPYTEGLIEAQPNKKLKALPGRVPSLVTLPKGCKFHPRCKECREICMNKEPPLIDHHKRKVRCWKYDQSGKFI